MTQSIVAALFLSLSATALADHSHHGHGAKPAAPSGQAMPAPEGVSVNACWIRSMPNNLPMAAYFRVENASDRALSLVGVDADAFEHVMLHQTQSTGGMAKMASAESVQVPAKGSFSAEPGGYHVMLEKAHAPIVVGQTVQISFAFSNQTRLVADCQIKTPASLRY